MKNAKTSDSWLSGLSTPLLGFVAVLVTLYTYGAVQNWAFIEKNENIRQLKWETDFVDHLDKCHYSPSSLEICTRAFQKTVSWIQARYPSQQLHSFSSSDNLVIGTVFELKRKATAFADHIPSKLESEATLVALNSWIGQIDRYSHLLGKTPSEKTSHSWQLLATQSGVSTIKIKDFNSPEMCDEIKTTLSSLQADARVYSLKLDLRGNPGGLVDTALCVGDLFVPKGSVLARFEKTGTQFPFQWRASSSVVGWIRKKLKIENFTRKAYRGMVYAKSLDVILDRNSASAAEMLAAGLKDSGRARLIGEKSYGKSSIQLPAQFEELGGIKAMVTTYKWLRPQGTSIAGGLIPDQIISL